jgi:hypothetical protein
LWGQRDAKVRLEYRGLVDAFFLLGRVKEKQKGWSKSGFTKRDEERERSADEVISGKIFTCLEVEDN